MKELVFKVKQEGDGGFCAEGLTESIVTEANTWEELRVNVREAVQGYFFDRLEKAAVPIRLLRLGLIVFLCFQPCLHSYADPAPELKASIIPGMTLRTPQKATILDSSTPPKAIQVDGWLYHFTVLLKNISNHPVRVTTESLGVSGATEQATQTFRLSSLEDMRVQDSLVIPPADKLGLVDLRPGELAYLNFEFDVDKPLIKIAVTYAPTTLADGRFGFWTGEVTSDFVSISPK